MKLLIVEKEMKRKVELFLIILLPILGLLFLGEKIMTLTKRPEHKITKHFFKESCTKIKRRNKKRTSSLSERTRTEGYWFSQSTKFKSWIRSDWLGSDTMGWWWTDNSWILYECLWTYKSYWRIGLESRYPNKWWQYIESRWDVYRIRHWYRGKIIWLIGI